MVVLSRTFDTVTCKLHPSTTMDAPESMCCYSLMMDAHSCLEDIFAPFFFKSIAWKEGDGIGTSASLFAVKQPGILRGKIKLRVYDAWISEKRTSAGSVVDLLLLAGFSSFPL